MWRASPDPLTPPHRQSPRRAFKDTSKSPRSVRPERHILGNLPIGSRLTAGRTQFQRWNCFRASARAIRLIAFITEPGPIRKILTHLSEPLEPPPVSPTRGLPTDWGELVQVHDDCDVVQGRIGELPEIDIHSL
jgi:hypothetical protein